MKIEGWRQLEGKDNMRVISLPVYVFPVTRMVFPTGCLACSCLSVSPTCCTSSYSQICSSIWASSPSPALICSPCIPWSSIKDYCQKFWLGQLSGILVEINTNWTEKPLCEGKKIWKSIFPVLSWISYWLLQSSFRLTVKKVEESSLRWTTVYTSGSPVLLCASAKVWGIWLYTNTIDVPISQLFLQTWPLHQILGAYFSFAVIFLLNVANCSTECCCWIELACCCSW